MMEFTLTRALMFACGIMVLAASLSPVAHIYGSRCGSVTMEQCDMVADMVDSFMGSGLDSIVIQCSDIIPDGCVLYVDDGIIVIERDGACYTSAPSSYILSKERFTPSDTMLMVKTEERIEMRSI